MRGLFLATAALISLTANVCWAGGFETTGNTDGHNVRVTFDRARPTQGENRVEITITDTASRPVANAGVSIEYLMPTLPGKPPMMDYRVTAKPAGNAYVATVDFTMKGQWKMIVSIDTGKGAKQVEQMTFGFEVK